MKRAPGGLTEKQKAFCRHYVVSRNASDAAARAGMGKTPGSQKVAGYRQMQNPLVQAEIARLDSIAASRTTDMMANAIIGADPAKTPERHSIAEQVRRETDADLVAATTRAYILAGLIENFEITLGRRKRTMIRFRTVKDEKKQRVVLSEEIEIFDPNPAAANQAAVVLLKELGLEKNPEEGEDQTRREDLNQAVRIFRKTTS